MNIEYLLEKLINLIKIIFFLVFIFGLIDILLEEIFRAEYLTTWNNHN
jgi:hypothetical protein